MTNFYLRIYSFLKSRKWFFVILLTVSFTFLGIITSKIKLYEDIAGFMPNNPESERINFVYKNIQIADKIVVRFYTANGNTDEGKQLLTEAAETFAMYVDSATQERGLVKEMLYKVDQQQILEISDFITKNIPYFLTEKDYRHIDSLINPENIHNILENNKKVLVSPSGIALKENLITDPLHLSGSTLLRLKDFQITDQYENYDDYIFSKKENNLMFFITTANASSETANNKLLVQILDAGIKKISSLYKNTVSVSYFGSAPVAVTNAGQIKKDSILSMIIALALILSLLLWFFKDIKSILFIALPVVFGGLFSLTVLYFIKGGISAIALGTGAVMFGIAISYSLHFLIHTQHETDMKKAVKELSTPMLTGSLTTVGAFLSLLFISADSMKDLGLFAAFSLIGTLLFVLVFMPHLIGKPKAKHGHSRRNIFDTISEYRYERNKYILTAVVVLSVIFFFFSNSVAFDSDMSKINYMTPQQRAAFKELSNYSHIGKTSMYHAAEGSSIQQALREYEKQKPLLDSLQQLGEIDIAGIGTFLPSDSLQKIKIEQWNLFWIQRKDKLKKIMLEQGKSVGFKPESFNRFFVQLDQIYTVKPISEFSAISDNFAKQYLIEKEHRAAIISLVYTHPDNSKDVARKLTRDNSFVFDMGVFSRSLIQSLSNDFNTVLLICSILVFLMLTLSFGRLELSLIAFLPMALSWVWILGIMSVFDIRFNIVNIILATFIFGLGDDYTLFMMDGMMNEYAYRRKLLVSYKRAVALSAITMFIGIGSLIFAKHPAMKSLASVTIIGMICVVVISYVVPPLLYTYITSKKGKKRLTPITFTHWFATFYSFLFFLAGSMALTIYGFVKLKTGKPTEKNKLKYHEKLCSISRYVVKHIPLVKLEVINTPNETFQKPGIIICNHQAHLDLMYLLMLSPKIVVLTNQWVWNSPFYGQLIRYADFYPVMNGVENSVEKLSTLIERGYSIAIFPEGTRSEDCSILRFRRGAFYLAEKLNADIIPIVFHGIGHALPKKELLLRRGKVTVNVLDRILPENQTYGENYSQRAKQIRRLYQKEYTALQQKYETPHYYHSLVYHNYIYKGTGVERQAKRELKRYNNFETLISLLPDEGVALIPNCGYGIFALMCSLVKKNLTINAFDADEDKIQLAKNCASLPERLHFGVEKIGFSYDYAVLINPADVEDVKPFADKKIYILMDKKNEGLVKITNFVPLIRVKDTENYVILEKI